ncbi:protein kinase domain-containing protein [Spirillospora sp. CA-294931]|uniref:protein kinase domain-containing protein n=1 Tax=Spirillospora sp. CA-294931 TaxID=3240042 RepID=UPI003D8CD2EF
MADEDVALVWRPGEVILGLYEVRDEITSGGMGVVYRVLHRGWNVELAVKVPRADLVASGTGVREFETEAAAWVGLGAHPNTVKCVYVRTLGGVPRVFAEWLDGGSLADAVREGHLYAGGRRAALRRVLDVAAQTARGLEHAHRNGHIHQDVKPANVLLDRDGTAKVTDFGLAGARAAAGESATVPPGASLLAGYGGMTPAYCSPEQAEAAERVRESGGPLPRLTRATDTWSWALTVLEMFVGHPPCPAGQVGAEVFAAFADAGARADAFTGEEFAGRDERLAAIPAMPGGLVTLLRECLAPEPSDRPRDMGRIADAVADVYAEAVGERYPRPEPLTAVRLADELSNQALSMLDLGRDGEAEELWRRAAEADPRNPHVAFNRGLRLWRGGERTDAEVVADLEGVRAAHPEDWEPDYLLGLLHLERGDPDAATEALRAARERAPEVPEIAAALDRAGGARRPAGPRALAGHDGPVNAVAFSGDGRFGLSAGEDEKIHVWDLARRSLFRIPGGRGGARRVRTLKPPGAGYGVRSIAVDADGARAVFGGHDGPAQIWDLRAGRLSHELTSGPGMIDEGPGGLFGALLRGPAPYVPTVDVATSADGRLALTVHGDGAVRIWDAATGRCLRRLADGHDGSYAHFASVHLDRDGDIAFGLDRTTGVAHTWDARTGAVLRTFGGPSAMAAMSADGGIVVTQEGLARGTRVRIWDRESGREIRALDRPNGLGDEFAMSGDGRYAISCDQNAMELWELGTGRRLRSWPTPERAMVAALSPDGRRALIGDDEGRVALWELPVPGPAAPWSYPLPREAAERLQEDEVVDRALDRSAELMAGGRFAAAAEEIRRARAVPGYRRHRVLLDRWQDMAREGRRGALLDAWVRDTPSIVGDPRVPPVVSDDGSLVLTGDADGTVHVWDLARGVRRHALTGHDGPVHGLALAGDGPIALSGGEDGTARVWDVESGRCLHVLDGHRGEVAVAVSADGRVGASGGEDKTVRVWNLETGEPVCRITDQHSTGISRLLLDAAGSRVVSTASGDAWAPHLWDARTGRRLHVPPRDLGGGWGDAALALSRHGDVLLSGHPDGTLRTWDVRTGATLHTMTGHGASVRAVAISADGTSGVALGEDGTARFLDLASGAVRAVAGQDVDAWCAAIAGDGRFAVTDGGDDQVRLWDAHSGACLRVLGRHDASVEGLALSTGGRGVTSLGHNGVARAWELDWEFGFPQ